LAGVVYVGFLVDGPAATSSLISFESEGWGDSRSC